MNCACGKTLNNLRSLELHLDKCQAVQSPDQDSSARANQIQGEKMKLRRQASSQLATAFAKRQQSPTQRDNEKKRKISSLVVINGRSPLDSSALRVPSVKSRLQDINDDTPLNNANTVFTDPDLLNLDGFMFGAHLWSDENFVAPEFCL
jgi:hypothetical protein